jgi:hypothetical protein
LNTFAHNKSTRSFVSEKNFAFVEAHGP